VTAGQESPDAVRHALYYPAREGQGMRLAELLARRDVAAADDPRGSVLRSTIFQRDDIVVRLVDARGELATDAGQDAELTALLDGGAVSSMDLVTDRRSPDA